MFHISVFELAITCGFVLLLFIVPVIVARFHAQMDARLKKIEKKLAKKD